MTTAPDQTTDILRRQAEPEIVQLIRAYSRRYIVSARYVTLRLAGALLLALAAPVVILSAPAGASILGVVAAAWLIGDRLVLAHVGRRAKHRALAAHELYDTTLFDLPWNRALAGRRPAPEDLADDAARKKMDPEYLTWYTVPAVAARPADVLLCQRQNAGWTRRLRTAYTYRLLAAAVIWLGVGIALALWQEMTLAAYLAQIFLPSAPGFLAITELVVDHWEGARYAQTLAEDIDEVFERQKRGEEVTIDDCRRVQDAIYRVRHDFPQPPTWYFTLRRKRDQAAIDAGVHTLASTLPTQPHTDSREAP